MFNNLLQILTDLLRPVWSTLSDLGLSGFLGNLQKNIDRPTLFAGIGVFLFLVSLGLYKWRKDKARRRKLLEEFNAALEEAEGLEEPRPPITPPRKRPSASPQVARRSIPETAVPMATDRTNFEEDFSSQFAEDWDALRDMDRKESAGSVASDTLMSTTPPDTPADVPLDTQEPEETFISEDNIDTILSQEEQASAEIPSSTPPMENDGIPDPTQETETPAIPPARRVLTLELENQIDAPETPEPNQTSEAPPRKRPPIMLSLENLIDEPVVLPDADEDSPSAGGSAESSLKAFDDLQKEVEKTIHNLGREFKDHFVDESADGEGSPEQTQKWTPENARRVIQNLESLGDRLEKHFETRKTNSIEQTMLTPASSLGEQFKTEETGSDEASSPPPLDTLESLLFTQKRGDDRS